MAVMTRAEFEAQTASLLADNTSGDITAEDLREQFGDLIDSALLAEDVPLNKLDGTAAPTVNDDSAAGYSVGSIWVNVTDDDAYICADASAGAAVWVQIDAAGGGSNLDEAATEVTISSGVITPTATKHTVDTEADAASDDLDLIDGTNLDDGDLLILRAANTARTVVLKHNAGTPTGNQLKIFLSGDADFTLDDDEKSIILERRGSAGWYEIGRSEGDLTDIGANQTPTGNSAGTAIEARTQYLAFGTTVDAPTADTYDIPIFLPFPIVLTGVRHRTSTGTCDIVVKKNGTAIDGFGTAVGASSTATTTPSTETATDNDIFSVTVSNVSAAEDLVVCLQGTRTGE